MLNGILVFNKPMDFTSHDAVAKLRGILKMRKIGHAGTLDPNAEGVLCILLGSATKASEYASGAEKEYIATIRLGMTSDTQDIWGEIVGSEITLPEKQVRDAVDSFKGEYTQLPPMYSAIWSQGVRLYDLARKGIEIERDTRTVELSEIEYLGMVGGDYKIRVLCSKGTYIRTLCHDIGQKLGCGAVMTSLVRIRSGDFKIENALTFEQVKELKLRGEIELHLSPPDSIFTQLTQLTLNDEGEKRTRHGAHLTRAHFEAGEIPPVGELCRVYSKNGELMIVGRSGVLDNGGNAVFNHKTFFETK